MSVRLKGRRDRNGDEGAFDRLRVPEGARRPLDQLARVEGNALSALGSMMEVAP